MYSITKEDYGLILKFSGSLSVAEMKDWIKESENLLKGVESGFSVLVDMRDVSDMPNNASDYLLQGQKHYANAGMAKSVVVHNDPTLLMQLKLIAKESDINKNERYINSNNCKDWFVKAINYIVNDIDIH